MTLTKEYIEEKVRLETEDCVEKRKKMGLNFLFKTRRRLRPACEAEARSKYDSQLRQLSEAKAKDRQTISDVFAAQSAGGDKTKLYGIIGGVFVFMLLIVIITR